MSDKAVVLIVDDERGVQRVVQRFLERAGFETIACVDLGEVLVALDGGAEPALVLTDWSLPGAGGARVALEVRRRLPGTPVLYMTGFDELEGLDPAEPIIRKPFRADELVAVVRRVIEAGTVDVLIGAPEPSAYSRSDVSGQHRVVKLDADQLEQARELARRRPRRP